MLHARERLRRSDLSGALTLPSTGGALALSAAAALTFPQIAAPDSSIPLRTPLMSQEPVVHMYHHSATRRPK